MEILENVALAPLTTLGVGGPARCFVEARTLEEAREALLWAREHRLPVFILGGGSNLVVSDDGWPGMVVHVALAGIERHAEGGKIIYRAGAGVTWDEFVRQAVAEGCAGVECLSGIPGTVGATPVQNVGAYGQEVSETICAVEAVDLNTLKTVSFAASNCGFTYRASRFNTADRGRHMILRVDFALTPGGHACLRYAELKAHFDSPAAPSLAEVRQAVLEIRRGKAMVIEESEPDSKSVGSFFKNPVVTRALYRQIAERYEGSGLRVPGFDTDDGRVKLSAAWLLEQAGVRRGFQLGPAAVSRRHTLALVNRGGATARDLLRLKDLVQAKVREAFALELEPEPVFLGFKTGDGLHAPSER